MDKKLIDDQIKKIDEEIERALNAISEIEDIVKKGTSSIDENLTKDYSLEIRSKFSLLNQKVEELTRAIVSTGIISDNDIEEDIQSRH